jgi:hypothetical protein
VTNNLAIILARHIAQGTLTQEHVETVAECIAWLHWFNCSEFDA